MSQNNPNKTSDCKTQKIFLVFNEKISTSSDDLRCKIIHEQQELDEQFINKATQDGLEFEKLYYKQHTVDDVLQDRIPTFAGWTPGKILLNNGFEFVESIDLLAKSPFKIYGSNQRNHYISTNDKGELKDSLELKRELLVEAFDHLAIQYKSNPENSDPAILYITKRGWPGKWYDLEIWQLGKYYTDQARIRKELSTDELDLITQKIQLKPDDVELWRNKARILSNRKQFENAISCYTEIIQLKPDDVEAWFQKGVKLSILGQYDKALYCFTEAIRLNPVEDTWGAKAELLLRLGQYEQAISCYTELIKFRPRVGIYWHHKGRAFAGLGKHVQALEYYDKASEWEPDYNQVWKNKGYSYAKLGKPEQALECYEKAIEFDRNDSDIWNKKGQVLESLGRNLEAKECFEKAKKLSKN